MYRFHALYFHTISCSEKKFEFFKFFYIRQCCIVITMYYIIQFPVKKHHKNIPQLQFSALKKFRNDNNMYPDVKYPFSVMYVRVCVCKNSKVSTF